uniref:Uncharacterized protein n=1 Tax=Anguilla anguilla TaxID=7936 RepID=A0A0E9QL20_ANGAN
MVQIQYQTMRPIRILEKCLNRMSHPAALESIFDQYISK